MKLKLWFISFSALSIIGCAKPEIELQEETYKIKEGTYRGTFYRTISWQPITYSAVTISFTSNTWEGTSEFAYYPALCHGTYSLQDSTITFVNECVWPAHFSWTLILSGIYYFRVEDETINFVKILGVDSANFVHKDVYRLTLQE